MNTFARRMVHFAVDRPRTVTAVMLVSTFLLLLGAALPTVAPDAFPFMHPARVDTDPENMLAHDEPVRVDHREVRERFSLHDGLVVGVVVDGPSSVFTPETLTRIHHLTEFAKGLDGVVVVDVFAPSTVDSVESGGPGVVRFQWLMGAPPVSAAEALAVRDRAMRIPMLRDTLVSADGRALALYIPLTDKHLAEDVTYALEQEIASMGPGAEQWHIAGLPVAEDTFGREMFIQMAISAPVAMLVIFLLMWVFFRRVVVIISPMVVAMHCRTACKASGTPGASSDTQPWTQSLSRHSMRQLIASGHVLEPHAVGSQNALSAQPAAHGHSSMHAAPSSITCRIQLSSVSTRTCVVSPVHLSGPHH